MSSYSIWVLEYAHIPNFPLSALLYGSHNQGDQRMPFSYVLIKGKGHVALVDVGYNHKAYGEVLANTYGVQGWQSPRTVLADVGLVPEDISTVFLTSTSNTLYPFRARSIAVGDPAHRAPTTITSYIKTSGAWPF